MKKKLYKVLIIIFIMILIGRSIYFYLKYNKYMISNVKYNVLSLEITYNKDNGGVFLDEVPKMAKNFQEMINIEESSDRVKKVFSELLVKNVPVNQYFNEDFFKNKNVIVFFDTVLNKTPDITVIKEKNVANIYYNGRGGTIPCSYARFVIVDKDIEEFEFKNNKYTKKYLIIQEILIEGTLLISIIIIVLKMKNKISTEVVIIFIVIAFVILTGIAYANWLE